MIQHFTGFLHLPSFDLGVKQQIYIVGGICFIRLPISHYFITKQSELMKYHLKFYKSIVVFSSDSSPQLYCYCSNVDGRGWEYLRAGIKLVLTNKSRVDQRTRDRQQVEDIPACSEQREDLPEYGFHSIMFCLGSVLGANRAWSTFFSVGVKVTLIPQYLITLVRRCLGVSMLLYFGALAPLHLGTSALRHFGTLALWHTSFIKIKRFDKHFNRLLLLFVQPAYGLYFHDSIAAKKEQEIQAYFENY
jgi:hypothetical protein